MGRGGRKSAYMHLPELFLLYWAGMPGRDAIVCQEGGAWRVQSKDGGDSSSRRQQQQRDSSNRETCGAERMQRRAREKDGRMAHQQRGRTLLNRRLAFELQRESLDFAHAALFIEPLLI